MRVWSVSPFLNEIDVLRIKLAEQTPVVDVFAFVEAIQDHQGRPRASVLPSYLDELRVETDAEIRYLSISFPLDLGPWPRESYQRASLAEITPDIDDDDLVVVSDLDEIVSAVTLRALVSGIYPVPTQIGLPIFPYRLDWRWTRETDGGWARATATTGSLYRSLGPQGVIDDPSKAVIAGEFGWHFTYQGDAETIAKKARSVADGWTGSATDADAERSIATGADLFGRDRPARRVPLNELPRVVRDNPERFAHLLGGGVPA